MSAKERAPLGFGNELDDFDPATWTKSAPSREKPKPEATKQAAEAAGFRSREPAKSEVAPQPAPRQQRRRRTGRNVQFNIKTKPETIEAFTRVADEMGWGFGEAFERATELLEREHPIKKP